MEGRTQEAQSCYEESLGVRWELYQETGTARAAGDLGQGFREIGEMLQAAGRLEEAERFYEDSRKLYESLAEESSALETRHLLAVGMWRRRKASCRKRKPTIKVG